MFLFEEPGSYRALKKTGLVLGIRFEEFKKLRAEIFPKGYLFLDSMHFLLTGATESKASGRGVALHLCQFWLIFG